MDCNAVIVVPWGAMKISPKLAVSYSESWLTPISSIKSPILEGPWAYSCYIGRSARAKWPTFLPQKHVMQCLGRCTPFFVKIKTTAVPFVINKKTMWFNFKKISSDKLSKSSLKVLCYFALNFWWIETCLVRKGMPRII